MLRFTEPELETSCRIVSGSDTIEQLCREGGDTRFFVTGDGPVYALAASELSLLSLGGRSGLTLDEAIARAALAPSPVCGPDGPGGAETLPRERPLVVRDGSRLLGVITTAAAVEWLSGENARLAAYFAALAETVGDAVTAVDAEGRVICWNEAAEETYGIPRESILGRRIGDHFASEAVMLYRILDEGRTVRSAYHQPTPDKHVLISASPILEERKVVGGVAAEQDVTRIVRLNEELYAVPQWIGREGSADAFLNASDGLNPALRLARNMAGTDTPVLLIGEEGTERELIAQTIHDHSRRANGPFLTVNCSAYPAGVLETELFGYRGGAFTGADAAARPGKLELARHGTLFLDEIDALPFELQVRLVRMLEQGSFYRVGSDEPMPATVRIIAAAGPELHAKWSAGEIRGDLYYKINVASIHIPPLRERIRDIPELVQVLLRQISAAHGKPLPKLDNGVMTALLSYDWPGNLRELRQVTERFVLLQENGAVTAGHLPREMTGEDGEPLRPGDSDASPGFGRSPGKASADAPEEAAEGAGGRGLALKLRLSYGRERELIEEALRTTHGNKSAAAKLLGVSRGTLYNKMKEYNLTAGPDD